jgi:eukaryotic-like serine/threonine-protein kinase
VESAIEADAKENGAVWEANSALQDAAFGGIADSRRSAEAALKLAPASKAAKSEVALAYALADQNGDAEALARDLEKRYPLDSQIQALWLSAIHAQMALNRKNPAEALNELQVADSLEFAVIPFGTNVSGNATAAAGEFRKIIEHDGIVWNCWTGALAHLGIARANALQAKASQGADADAARVRALSAYKQFLSLWKDADADIPLLKQVKAEYGKLQ